MPRIKITGRLPKAVDGIDVTTTLNPDPFDGFKFDVASVRNDISNIAPPEEIGAQPEQPKPPANPFAEVGVTPFKDPEDDQRNQWSNRKRKRFDKSLIGMQDTPEQRSQYLDWYNKEHPQNKFLKGFMTAAGAIGNTVNNFLPAVSTFNAVRENKRKIEGAEKRYRDSLYDRDRKSVV